MFEREAAAWDARESMAWRLSMTRPSRVQIVHTATCMLFESSIVTYYNTPDLPLRDSMSRDVSRVHLSSSRLPQYLNRPSEPAHTLANAGAFRRLSAKALSRAPPPVMVQLNR